MALTIEPILQTIFSFLEAKDVCKIASVNKLWNRESCQDELWHQLYKRTFDEEPAQLEQQSGKKRKRENPMVSEILNEPSSSISFILRTVREQEEEWEVGIFHNQEQSQYIAQKRVTIQNVNAMLSIGEMKRKFIKRYQIRKVVYNCCYGGFGLSAKAKEALKLKGYDCPEDLARDNLDLVHIVEELGDEANGVAAKLSVDWIPSTTFWSIGEYDGCEGVIRDWFAKEKRSFLLG